VSDFIKKLMNIRTGFNRKMKFIFLIDLIIFFSIIYSITLILSLSFFLKPLTTIRPEYIQVAISFVLSLIFSLLIHRKDKKINITAIIENKRTELKEKLSTAYDNKDRTNIIIESLKSDVSNLLSNVKSSELFDNKKILLKLLIAILFISATYIIQSSPETYTIPPEKITNTVKNITGNSSTPQTSGIIGPSEDLKKSGKKGTGEIFGKPKIASIEGKSIDLTLYSSINTGFELKDTQESESQFIQSSEFPVDVVGSNVSDGGYNELMKKTELEKQIINKYAILR